jgi:hypothetical protein
MLSFRYLGYHVDIRSSVLLSGERWNEIFCSPNIPGAVTCLFGPVSRALLYSQFDIRNRPEPFPVALLEAEAWESAWG